MLQLGKKSSFRFNRSEMISKFHSCCYRRNDSKSADSDIIEEDSTPLADEIVSSFDITKQENTYIYKFNGIPVPSPPNFITPPRIMEFIDLVTSKLEGEIPVTYSDINYVFQRGATKMEFSCGSSEEFPEGKPEMPQIAFAGRSNVGKSSLLNALVDSDRLARVSSTPGHTKRINYFNMNNSMYVVDLPGYGYAEGNKEKILEFNDTFRKYCCQNSVLKRVFILIDARYGIYEQDCEFMDMLEDAAIPYQLVLTKCDKVSHEHLCEVMQMLYDTMKEGKVFLCCFPYIIPTSSEKMLGVQDLQAAIIRASGLLESGALLTHRQREEMTKRIEQRLMETNPTHPYFAKRDQAFEAMMKERQNVVEKVSGKKPEMEFVQPSNTVKNKVSDDIQKKMLEKSQSKKKKKKVNIVGLDDVN